ncbi:MAG TPA: S8 family serine peptidase, partial [Solirubrobacteraceae bacterium]
MRQTAALGLVAIAAGFLLLWAQAARAETVSPLPASDYTVKAACKPPSEGHATCMALQLVPTTAAARARTHPLGVTLNHAVPAGSAKEGAYGLTPAELHSAYGIPTTATGTQTIALVDAYNDPNAASDLKAYETEFRLKGCEEAACFTRVNEKGETANLPFPHNDAELKTALKSGNEAVVAEAEEAAGWDVEISLDIEAARATCENCHILLVEASSTEDGDLSRAEDWAAEHGGPQEISNSWGGPEGESATPFDHPDIVITASAGDDGYRSWNAAEEYERDYTSFPASSPDVVAVGGTRLMRSSGKWQSETVWNDGGESAGFMDGYGATGGGCSELFTAQPWQQHVADWSKVGCGTKRAVSDVAADGDPLTGFALYDTNPAPEESASHWYTYGGTSLSSPIVASTFALAGGSGGVGYPAETLYGKAKLLPASLHD